MARVEVTLQKGLLLDEKPQTLAVLRDLTAADIIEAAEASEKMVQTDDGPILVQSPARMGTELLGRQIEKIGDIPGPLSTSMIGKLSKDDLILLQEKAELLDDAIAEDISNRGRDDPAIAGVD